MTKIVPVLLIALIVFSFFSFCTKEDEKNQLAMQEKSIDQFIKSDTTAAKSKNKDTVIIVTHKKETNRIVWNPAVGDTLAPGDTVYFSYIARIFNSGKGAIFADSYCRNVVGNGYFIPGLDAGLIGMRVKEYAYVLFTSQYGYGNKEISIVPKMSPLMFEVEIKNIDKKK